MLGPEQLRVSKKEGQLKLVRIGGKERQEVLELCALVLAIARDHAGESRERLEDAYQTLLVAPRLRRMLQGFVKLVEDASEFAAPLEHDAAELRSALFLKASARRAALGPIEEFDRAGLVAEVAGERGLSAEQLEAALYSDLRGEQRLLRPPSIDANALFERYERASVQAVLLRAVRLVADVECRDPAAYRRLFRKLKFRRLLHRIEARGGGYRIEIDGPYSLFESVTKYGLALALTLPALEECDRLSLMAEVRWGKRREALTFYHQQVRAVPDEDAARLPDDVAALLEGFRSLESSWSVESSSEILELTGVGLCVPDLVFQHQSGARVFLEVMGYWSRDAVWRRVELVEAGLRVPVLFAVSQKLRVSEAVLEEGGRSALYVYKATMSPRAVLRKLEQLRA